MSTAPLLEPYRSSPLELTALCVWREARSESMDGKKAVTAVIRNRCAMAPAQGFAHTPAGNILKPNAFSSFRMGDPNSVRYPSRESPAWQDSMAAALSAGPDLSGGAVFYHDISIDGPRHDWPPVELSASIGRLRFYRIAHPPVPVVT